MGRIPNELKTLDSNQENREKIYKKYLSITNGTQNLTFEEDNKLRINKEIKNILEDSRLSEKNAKIMDDYYLFLVNASYSVTSRKTYLQYVRNIAVGIKKNLIKSQKEIYRNTS